MEIVDYTRERIPDVMDFERRLREEEPFYNWEIDEAYQKRMEAAFDDPRFVNAVSLLAGLRRRMKQAGAGQLIALMAANGEAQRFYRAVEGASIHDEGIWIGL